MPADWDTVWHLATSTALIIFGVGAWSAQRKSGEQINATDVARLTTRVESLEKDKVNWKDFDRSAKADQRTTDLQIENVCDRVDQVEGRVSRLEGKVFNGGHRHGS